MISSHQRHLLVLGSNIDAVVHLPAALRRLAKEVTIESVSAIYVSPAVGAPGTPDFHNQALLVRAEIPLEKLRRRLRAIEAELGRERDEDRNAPRTIDIDWCAFFDESGIALTEPPPDPDLCRYHHLAHPAAELLPHARLAVGGPPLTDIARMLGPTPPGFRRLPSPLPL